LFAVYSCGAESEDAAQINAKSSTEVTVDSYLSLEYASYDVVASIIINIDDENVKVTKYDVGDQNVDVYTFSNAGSDRLNESLILNYENDMLQSDDFVNDDFSNLF